MSTDPLIGQKIKDFVILEQIGRGGMAKVYRAAQPSIHRDVALKIINLSDESRSPEFRRRFAQEAELIAGLEHLHILPVYDYGIAGEYAFLAMRLLRGGTLQDLLDREQLPLDRSAALFRQFASGLAYAHSRGVVHRDLKPSNILLDETGNTYIADFGLAKIIGGTPDLTLEERIIGTPHYIAPEQVRGDEVTHRADIYSLGVVLYRMVTGRLPFEDSGRDMVSLLYQNIERTPPRPREVVPDLPPTIEEIILRAMAKRPKDRYDSAKAIARDFDHALGRNGGTVSYPTAPISRYSFVRARRQLIFKRRLGLLALVLLLGVVGGLLLIPQNPHPAPHVLAGKKAIAEEIIPTQNEIALARRYFAGDEFIAFIACNQSSEYHATQAREIRDFARGYGLEIRIYDADSDAYQQLTQLERARAEGARALVVCALDNALLASALRSAQEAGIRMVFLHGDIHSYGGVRITTDNYQMGYKPGRYAGKLITSELGGNADVIVLGYPDLADIELRAEGMQAGMLSLAPNARILGQYLGGTRENGQASVARLLAQGITFDVILSINDVGAYGAIAALEAAGYQGREVMIFSVDAENLARQFIRNRYFMRASIALGRTEAAQAAVDALVKLLAGATIAENVTFVPGELITREYLLAEAD